MSLEEEKREQFALTALSLDDRLILAKSLKQACERTNNIEEKRYYKIRIRELFTTEEWNKLLEERNKTNE